MASTSAAPPPSNTLSGPRASFTINGIVVGYASQCSVAQSYSYSPVNVIGSVETLAHIPTSYSASVTFNNLRLVGQTLRTLGWWVPLGNGPTEHLRNLVQLPELTAVLEDTVTNTVCGLILGVRIESSSLNVSAGGLWTEDYSCVCRRVLMEGDSL